MILPKYSVAIRTLGTAGEKFRIELESIGRQTVLPEKVIVYVAESTGVKFQDDCFCGEKYVYVAKGMVAQRVKHLTQQVLLLQVHMMIQVLLKLHQVLHGMLPQAH